MSVGCKSDSSPTALQAPPRGHEAREFVLRPGHLAVNQPRRKIARLQPEWVHGCSAAYRIGISLIERGVLPVSNPCSSTALLGVPRHFRPYRTPLHRSFNITCRARAADCRCHRRQSPTAGRIGRRSPSGATPPACGAWSPAAGTWSPLCDDNGQNIPRTRVDLRPAVR